MRRTRWIAILAAFVAAAVLTWIVLDLMLRHLGWVPQLTPWGAAVGVLMSMVVLTAGLAVKRLKAGQATWITPTGAATTAAAAQASAIVGSIIGGVYGGELTLAILAPTSPAMTSLMWSAGVCLLASLVWCGVGMLVEHWCAISMDDDDDHPGATPSTQQAGGAAARTGEH